MTCLWCIWYFHVIEVYSNQTSILISMSFQSNISFSLGFSLSHFISFLFQKFFWSVFTKYFRHDHRCSTAYIFHGCKRRKKQRPTKQIIINKEEKRPLKCATMRNVGMHTQWRAKTFNMYGAFIKYIYLFLVIFVFFFLSSFSFNESNNNVCQSVWSVWSVNRLILFTCLAHDDCLHKNCAIMTDYCKKSGSFYFIVIHYLIKQYLIKLLCIFV